MVCSLRITFSIKLSLMPLSFALTDGLGSMLHEERDSRPRPLLPAKPVLKFICIASVPTDKRFFHKPPDSLGKTKGHVLELHNFLFPEQSLSINNLDAFLLVICQRQAVLSPSPPGRVKIAMGFCILYTNYLFY